MQKSSEPVICIAEDRDSMEPGLRLLIHSLSAHSETLKAQIFFPNAGEEFKDWVSKYPNFTLRAERIAGQFSKYDVKPHALLELLSEGFEDVVWCDSDLIVAADIRPLFSGLSPSAIVITEEALVENHSDDNGLRAQLWGMQPGRVLPFTLNTSVLRVTIAHRPLLERWKKLLASTEYRSAQMLNPASTLQDRRPLHLRGDQEVLTALLASKEFSHVPIHYLMRGKDIVQFFGPYGYTLRERWWHLRSGMPAFIHSMGQKPWWPAGSALTAWDKFCSFYMQFSPYTVLAREHAKAVSGAEWLVPRGRAARMIHFLGFGHPALVGLPIAALADMVRVSKRARKWLPAR